MLHHLSLIHYNTKKPILVSSVLGQGIVPSSASPVLGQGIVPSVIEDTKQYTIMCDSALAKLPENVTTVVSLELSWTDGEGSPSIRAHYFTFVTPDYIKVNTFLNISLFNK